MIAKVKIGDKVRIKYSGLSKRAASLRPKKIRVLEFTVGSNEVIRGISLGVLGMSRGEQKQLTLDPQDAFGPVRRELFKEVPRGRFPERLKLHVGKRLTAVGAVTGRRRKVQVAEVNTDTVVIDGNHPLAGRSVVVLVELLSLKRQPAQ